MSIIEVGQTLSHYQLTDKLGEGGMGVVWRALDTRLNRPVAIKFLPATAADDSQKLAQFRREARAVAALSHPNIVTIHSVEEADGELFLTMEFVDGSPLSDQIPEHGMESERLLELAVPLADAISAAHDRGIIHRDLKPGNVMIGKDGGVKILDFGLAKIRDPEPETKHEKDASLAETRTDEVRFGGTVQYMSPEQLRGEVVDHRADVYALGVLLFEMATGTCPFQGGSMADVVAAALKDDPPAVSDLNPAYPKAFDRIVLHCMERDIRQRVQSAVDLRNELKQLRSGGNVREDEFGPSIAVLPFTDMSRERDQEYFCEGMAEEILNALSRVQDLRVASRTSSFQFRASGIGSREVGRRLRVGSLLEGSVRKAGNRLRITAQLINTANGYHMWSASYDRDLEDVFSVQEEIAAQIVQAMRVRLTVRELGELKTSPTQDVQAYDYYLRGRKFYYQYGPKDMEFALQLFTRAIELDPGYAPAWAGLADCSSYIYLYSDRSAAMGEQADEASAMAVELDPQSAQAQASRGVALSACGRDEEAVAAFETGIELDPSSFEAHYFFARNCFAAGELEKALKLYERASEVCPEDFQALLLMAQIYDDLGLADKARQTRRRGVAKAEERMSLNPDDTRALYMAANGLVALGEPDQGIRWARKARTMDPDNPMLLYNVACILAMAGQLDEAIESLEAAMDQGLRQKGWFEHDNNLDSLRDHPRFQKLMKTL